jgi:hypothetical protein
MNSTPAAIPVRCLLYHRKPLLDMKFLFFILTLLLFTQCSSKKNPSIESDIFIASLDNGFDSSGKLILKDTTKAIRFSKDFWNYFIRTHPKTSSMLFISPLYDTSNNYVALGDTSLQFYNIAHLNSFYFTKLLADSADGKENENSFTGSAFFAIPNDTTGSDEKEKRVKQKLNDYKITPAIREEFNKLKNILTWKDTSNHYIVVFKKKFVDNIYKLYE